jgi:hypothetical protein
MTVSALLDKNSLAWARNRLGSRVYNFARACCGRRWPPPCARWLPQCVNKASSTDGQVAHQRGALLASAPSDKHLPGHLLHTRFHVEGTRQEAASHRRWVQTACLCDTCGWQNTFVWVWVRTANPLALQNRARFSPLFLVFFHRYGFQHPVATHDTNSFEVYRLCVSISTFFRALNVVVGLHGHPDTPPPAYGLGEAVSYILVREESETLPTWCTPRTHPPIAPPGRGQHLVPCRYSVSRVFQPVTFPPCGSWPMLCLGGEQTTAWVCGLDEALHRATYMLSLATHAQSGHGSVVSRRPVVMHGLATAWVL